MAFDIKAESINDNNCLEINQQQKSLASFSMQSNDKSTNLSREKITPENHFSAGLTPE